MVACMAALVVFGTVYALVMPAATLEGETYCGMEEHTHDDSCYASVLACGQEEGNGHVHDDSCYETQLVCQLPEHTHTDACYAAPAGGEAAAEVTASGERVETDAPTEADEPAEAAEPAETAEAAALPDGAQVPEGYTRQYTVRDEEHGFAVTVYAPEGVVPEGAVLSAALLQEGDEAYAQAEHALAGEAAQDAAARSEDGQAAETDYGFAALDIHFADAAGNEVEPNGDVYVVIDADGLLPEDVDPASVTVQHHTQQDDGQVALETVADAADATEGVVAVTGNADAAADVQTAFSVDAFSTFTIRWNQGSQTINVHYGVLDKNGTVQELAVAGATQSPINFTNGNMINNFGAPSVSGYQYTGTAYVVRNSGDQTQIYDLRFVTFGGYRGWQYDTSSAGDNWSFVGQDEIYFIYEADQPDVIILDTILENGSLTAQTMSLSEGVTVQSYTWYRSAEPEANSGYIAVEGVTGDTVSVVTDGARHYYYVVANLSNGEALTSEPFQVAYYNSLQNGSFENPDYYSDVVSSYRRTFDQATFMQIPNGIDGFIWQTTGYGRLFSSSSYGYYTEIVKQNNYTSSVYGVTGAADGDQFAELNCETAGALYQDVLTVPGSTLYWGLEHSDRSGGQESRLLLLISDTATLPENFDPTDVNSIAELGLSDDIQLDTTASTVGWQYYSGSYVVPEGQYVTRFYFVAGNGATEGNLLDNISFSSELPAPPENQGNLVLTKQFAGFDNTSDYANESITFTITDGDGETVNATLSADNNWTSILTLAPGDYTVTETQPTAIEGYTYSSTSIMVGENGTTNGLSTTVTVEANGSVEVTFTNTYTTTGGGTTGPTTPVEPDHNKYVKDNQDGTYDLSLDVSGEIETHTEKIPINVLYVLDTWSMNGTFTDDEDKYGKNTKERILEAQSAISALNNVLGDTEKFDARFALITFDSEVIEQGEWGSSSAEVNATISSIIEDHSYHSGTNYFAALTRAENLLDQAPTEGVRSTAQTIVIFLTDGQPNRPERPNGTSGTNTEYAQKQAELAAANISCDQFYAFGVGQNTNGEYRSNLDAIVTSASASTKEVFVASQRGELVGKFEDIVANITRVDCSNVVITDTLSEYAQLTDDATFQVSITDADGNPVAFCTSDGTNNETDALNVVDLTEAQTEDEGYLYFKSADGVVRKLTIQYDEASKTFTLTFPEDYVLENGWTYTITTQIEPTDAAYDYYLKYGSYPHENGTENVGDAGTDAPDVTTPTSSGQPGFDSNSASSLTYTSAGQDRTEVYPDPVIQVKLDVTIHKQDGTSQTALSGAEFQLYYYGGDDDNNMTKYYYKAVTTGEGETAETTVSWIPEHEITADNPATTLTSGNDGNLIFYHLDPTKTYYLVETKAPDGYQLLTHAIQFNWISDGTGADIRLSANYDSGEVTGGVHTTSYTTIKVDNTAGYELPATGGIGTTCMTIGGLALMAGAVGCGFALRRRRGKGAK